MDIQPAIDLLPDGRTDHIKVDSDVLTFPPGLQGPLPDLIPEPWQEDIDLPVFEDLVFHQPDRYKVEVVNFFQDFSAFEEIQCCQF